MTDMAVAKALRRARRYEHLAAPPGLIGVYLVGDKWPVVKAVVGRRRSDGRACLWYCDRGGVRIAHSLHPDADIDLRTVGRLADDLLHQHGHDVHRAELSPC